jgi:hypothetical protein
MSENIDFFVGTNLAQFGLAQKSDSNLIEGEVRQWKIEPATQEQPGPQLELQAQLE